MLTKKNEVVTPNVTISIVNSAGEKVDGVTSDEKDTFTITYNISFERYKKDYTRTVKIVEAS